MKKTKKDPYVTKSMLDNTINGAVNSAVETLLAGMDNLYKMFKNELEKRLKQELEPIKNDIVFIKRDIKDIKAELSSTPSRREFNNLKEKVERFHPAN